MSLGDFKGIYLKFDFYDKLDFRVLPQYYFAIMFLKHIFELRQKKMILSTKRCSV